MRGYKFKCQSCGHLQREVAKEESAAEIPARSISRRKVGFSVAAVALIAAFALTSHRPKSSQGDMHTLGSDLREAYVSYFAQHASKSTLASETAEFLRRDNVQFVMGSEPEGTVAHFDSVSNTITLDPVFFTHYGSIPVSIAANAPSVLHEVRHAITHRESPFPLGPKEDEIIACVDGFLFARYLARVGEAPTLDSIEKIVGAGSCSPWWNCPIKRSEQKKVMVDVTARLVDRQNGYSLSDIKNLDSWFGVKLIRGGWDSVASYCGSKGTSQSQFSIISELPEMKADLDSVLAPMERNMAIGKKQLSASEYQQLSGWVDDLVRKRKVLDSPTEVEQMKLFFSKRMQDVKRRVEDD
jgi:hypothetical protein